MHYFVRWTVPRNRGENTTPQAFTSISRALDRACELIAEHQPADIWVVDAQGNRAAADFEIRSYRRQRSPRPR